MPLLAKEGIFTIEKVNRGGVSDSKYSGNKYSVSRLVGYNLHEEPGLLKVAQKLTKDSAAVITEFCKAAVAASNGDIYWFSSESGKIWKTGSPYTLVHTTTPDKGEAKCLGAAEYGSYIYWFTEKRVHRIPISDLSDWATNAEEDVAEMNLDQAILGSTGNTYTTPTSISETATNRQSFTPVNNPIEAIGIHVTAVGTGNWTVTLHDASNNSLGAVTIANGSMATGWVIFGFAAVVNIEKASALHVHVTSTVADGTVTSSTSADLEDGRVKIFTTSDAEFHPAIKHFGILYFGDRHFIHQIEETSTGSHTFTREALDIEEPLRVKCLGKDPLNLLIGTIVSNDVAYCQFVKWNTYSESFTTADDVPEAGINAIIPSDNYVFVHAGLGGTIYLYDPATGALEQYFKIRGVYTPTAKATIHPNAHAMLGGISLLGVSNVSGNPADQGVWSLGRFSRQGYNFVFDLTYPISERSGSDFVLTGVEIGAIVVSGYNLYVAWKSASTAGAVDKLDYSNKLDGAFLETGVLSAEREKLQNFGKAIVAYSSKPANTSVAIATKLNHAASFTNQTVVVDSQRLIVELAEDIGEATTLEVKWTMTTSGNNAMEVVGGAVFLR